MKKSSKIILGIVAIMLLIGIAVGAYCFARNKNVSNEKSDELEEKSSNSSKVDIANGNNESTSIDVEPQKKDDEITSDKVLYIYSSGDNAAAHGNPEILYVYYMNEKEISFKYHAGWNETDIVGIARSSSGNKYVFENGNKKIELELNSMGENSIKVTEYKNNEVSSWKNLWRDADVSDNKNQNVADNSDENKPDDNKLNVNGSYKYEDQTDNYYHRSNIVITNQTDTSINFSINAAHGNDVDHVNVGEVSGIANKIDIPTDSVVPESEQIAYQYTENIDGNVNKITLICTAHRQFQYIEVTEEYPSGMNPYAGNRVYFSGEYDKIN